MKEALKPVTPLPIVPIQKSYSANPFQLLQDKNIVENPLQLLKEEEPLQPKFNPMQLLANSRYIPVQKKENNTGLTDHLKAGVEALSGYSMNDVRVHYNSDKPAQLHALAYAQGQDIHVGPGQEKHLPHEAWHVVQQRQGRVQATRQMKTGVAINDDPGLEQEADVMGEKANSLSTSAETSLTVQGKFNTFQAKNDTVVQAVLTIGDVVQGPITAEQVPDDEIRARLNGWRDDGAHAFATLDEAKAMAWLRNRNWEGDIRIENPTLTANNCHSLTFGGAGELQIATVEALITLLEQHGGNRVACLLGGAVAHTATLVDGRYRQTLPGGPIFTTNLALLQEKYECFQIPAQLQLLRARGLEIAAIAVIAERVRGKKLLLENAIAYGDEINGSNRYELNNQIVVIPTTSAGEIQIDLLLAQYQAEVAIFQAHEAAGEGSDDGSNSGEDD
jgi:hypothetical protein